MIKQHSLFFIVAFILLLVGTFGIVSMVDAATIVVDTATDSNNSGVECSLRDAIDSINNGAVQSLCSNSSVDPFGTSDRIEFNISGGGTAQTITLSSDLPPIQAPVVIDGFTQGGTCGTLPDLSDHDIFITIDGQSNFVFVLESNNFLVQGLDIINSSHGILTSGITSISGITVTCNTIQNTVNHDVYLFNVQNFEVSKNRMINAGGSGIVATDSSSVGTIFDNYIFQSSDRGIHVRANTTDVLVENNYVDSVGFMGIQADGGDSITFQGNTVVNSGSTAGVISSNTTNFVLDDNIIDTSTGPGVLIFQSDGAILTDNDVTGSMDGGITFNQSNNATITGNLITNNDGFGGLQLMQSQNIVFSNNSVTNNSNYGIITVGSSQVEVSNNLITGNGLSAAGILSLPFPVAQSDIAFLGNSITNNTFGIDIFSDTVGAFNFADWINLGPNVNDIGDTDTGANDYLNYPVIYDASVDLMGTPTIPADDITSIDFYLDIGNDSIARDVRVEFFSNGNTGLGDSIPTTLHGEGKDFIIACDVTHDGNGVQTYNTTTEGCDLAVSSGEIISSTATLRNVATPSTFGSTSEFGNTIEVESIGADYGDAPDTGTGTGTGNYQTDATDNGPYHIIADTVETYLGSCVDANSYTVGATPANGDDLDTDNPTAGTCATAGDDEDGILITSPFLNNTAGQTIDIIPHLAGADNPATVGIDNEGELFVWIDFNQNGSFEDAGEQVYNSQTDGYITSATTSISVDIPDVTVTGPTPFVTYARFRFNTRDINGVNYPLLSIGESLDGEVEDYQVTIVTSAGSQIQGQLTDMTTGTLDPNPDGITIELYIDNGIIGVYEPGIDTLIASQVTSGGTGLYSFTNLPDGNFLVQPIAPTNYTTTAVPVVLAPATFESADTTIQQVSLTPPTVTTQSTTSTTPTISGTYDGTNLTPNQVTITIDGTVYTNGDTGVTIAGGTWAVDLSLTTQILTAGSSYEVTVDTDNGAGLTASDSTTNEITITIPSSGGGGSVKFICKDPEATNYDDSSFGRHKQSLCEYEYNTEINDYLTNGATQEGNVSADNNTCPIFTQHMKKGDRDGYTGQAKQETGVSSIIKEVKLLQQTLLEQGFNPGTIDGWYGIKTAQAVSQWQTKHFDQVLKPWGLTHATGFFYKSSERWTNELLGCDDTVTLDNGVTLTERYTE